MGFKKQSRTKNVEKNRSVFLFLVVVRELVRSGAAIHAAIVELKVVNHELRAVDDRVLCRVLDDFFIGWR